MEVRNLSEHDYDQWNQLVERSVNGTIFHSSIWITSAAKILHLDYAIIGVFKDSQLIGGCSFYFKSKFHVFKTGYTNVPFFPYGGFVISLPNNKNTRSSELKVHEIFSLILEKIQTFNIFYMNLINSPAIIDIRSLKLQGWREYVYYTYILNLENDIFFNFSTSVRRSIRKSQKMGITVKKEYNPDIYWELTKKTFEKQNLKTPLPKEHLFKLMEMLLQNNLGEMWIARTTNGEPASAEFIIWDNKQAYRWIAASDTQFKDTNAATLLLFEIFQDLQKRGFHEINLMAGNMSNISTFISSFNPRLVLYLGVEKFFLFNSFFQNHKYYLI